MIYIFCQRTAVYLHIWDYKKTAFCRDSYLLINTFRHAERLLFNKWFAIY